jgi:hypothetical protein
MVNTPTLKLPRLGTRTRAVVDTLYVAHERGDYVSWGTAKAEYCAPTLTLKRLNETHAGMELSRILRKHAVRIKRGQYKLKNYYAALYKPPDLWAQPVMLSPPMSPVHRMVPRRCGVVGCSCHLDLQLNSPSPAPKLTMMSVGAAITRMYEVLAQVQEAFEDGIKSLQCLDPIPFGEKSIPPKSVV